MPAAELRARIARADFSSLASVDLSRHDPSEALAIGPEAPFYLSFGFDAVDRPDAALAMLEVASQRSPEPWHSEAGIALADRLIAGEEYAKAEAAARAVIDAHPAVDVAERARRALVEAIYWQKRDAEVLRLLPELPADPELDLFRAVCSWRLELPGARQLFVELFRTEPVSAIHGRAYAFLASDPAWLQRFSPLERDLLAAKETLVQGQWAKGIDQMEEVLAALDPAAIEGSSLVFDLGNACVYGSRFARGASFLRGVAARLSGQAKIDCLETAGRLARRAGDRALAVEMLSSVAKSTGSPEQADRARWYLLDVLIDQDPPDLVERVAGESRCWNAAAGFTDLLERLVSNLVAERRWRDIVRLRDALGPNGPAETRAQLAWLLARLLQEHKLQAASVTDGATASELFAEAARESPDSYFGVLAACLLGELPARAAAAAGAGGAGAPSADAVRRALGPLAYGFLQYGVTSEGYRRVQQAREALPPEVIQAAAGLLEAAGNHRGSLNLMEYLAGKGALARDGLRLLYPRPWSEALDSSAGQNRVPESLLAALVREESFFDPDIVSSAGAAGLTQLMPDTAADAARRLKITDPDLTDAVTSLRLGARHLRGLLDSTGSPAKALLAYNAGLSRLRGWERSWPDLPEDLLVEAVPYAESRGYVRKIVLSDLMYAWLYEGRDPRESLHALFASSRM